MCKSPKGTDSLPPSRKTNLLARIEKFTITMPYSSQATLRKPHGSKPSLPADPSLEYDQYGIRVASKVGLQNRMGCLHLAIETGDDPDLFYTKPLLGHGLDLERGDVQGIPLCLAMLVGHFHIAAALLAAGADTNARASKPKNAKTVLERVIAQGLSDIRRLQYLSHPERTSPSQTTPPRLSRPGPPASVILGPSTALHYLISQHHERTDSTFAACLHIVLNAAAGLVNSFALPSRNYTNNDKKT